MKISTLIKLLQGYTIDMDIDIRKPNGTFADMDMLKPTTFGTLCLTNVDIEENEYDGVGYDE
jgi:hypothetical protein